MEEYKIRFEKEWEKYYRKQLDSHNYYISRDVFKKEFRKSLIMNNELEFIILNLEQLIDSSFNENIILFKYFKDHKSDITPILLNKIYKEIINNMFYYKNRDRVLNPSELFIINELEKKNLSLFDVKLESQGSCSQVFVVGDTILKFGLRECIKLIDNSRIFYPEFKGYVGDNYIEITRKLFVDNNDEKLKNIMLNMYLDLRDEKVLWLDPKSLNIAKLTKEDLEYYYQNKEKRFNNDIIENPYYKDKDLSENDYVIIDLDLMYPEKNIIKAKQEMFNLNHELRARVKEFEKEYQRRKK